MATFEMTDRCSFELGVTDRPQFVANNYNEGDNQGNKETIDTKNETSKLSHSRQRASVPNPTPNIVPLSRKRGIPQNLSTPDRYDSIRSAMPIDQHATAPNSLER
jgi:hypothetical protein